jgi:mRNA interferase MazF
MAKLRRGEVWWSQLPAPAGLRPVLILTRNAASDSRTSITVAPLTRTRRGIDSEVDLSRSDGVPTDCTISLDNMLTIPKATLQRKIVKLAPTKLDEVCRAMHFALELPF